MDMDTVKNTRAAKGAPRNMSYSKIDPNQTHHACLKYRPSSHPQSSAQGLHPAHPAYKPTDQHRDPRLQPKRPKNTHLSSPTFPNVSTPSPV